MAQRLSAADMPAMLLWVLESNIPARKFYERLAGSVVREQPIDIGGVTVTEVAYGWPRLDVLRTAPAANTST